jgi:hypothetical protein
MRKIFGSALPPRQGIQASVTAPSASVASRTAHRCQRPDREIARLADLQIDTEALNPLTRKARSHGELLNAMGRFDLRRVGFDVSFDVDLMLEGGHHREEIACGWISARPDHAHQAFLGDAGFLAQRGEADGCVDAIAQEDEARRDFAVEERLQRLLQKGGFEGCVAVGAGNHSFAEIAGQGHDALLTGCGPFALFVVGPSFLGDGDVIVLSMLFPPPAEEEDQLRSVEGEIGSIPGPKIDSGLVDALSDRLHVRLEAGFEFRPR